MTRRVRVHLLPALCAADALRGGVAVVIDVLRATTTVVHALASEAAWVIPTLTVEQAHQVAAEWPTGSCVRGGERDGVLIPGFELDNNPLAYTPETVRGKTVVFTTTNGTAALLHAAQAERVLLGSFVNLQAVVRALVLDDRPVHLVCAGTQGQISAEDVLCAGAIVDRLAAAEHPSRVEWTDDSLQLAWSLYATVCTSSEGPSLPIGTVRSPLMPDAGRLLEAVRRSAGGRNCLRLGFDEQIVRAATLDLFDVVPEYDTRTGRMTRASVGGEGSFPSA